MPAHDTACFLLCIQTKCCLYRVKTVWGPENIQFPALRKMPLVFWQQDWESLDGPWSALLTLENITMACVVLHNFLCITDRILPEHKLYIPPINLWHGVLGEWRQVIQGDTNLLSRSHSGWNDCQWDFQRVLPDRPRKDPLAGHAFPMWNTRSTVVLSWATFFLKYIQQISERTAQLIDILRTCPSWTVLVWEHQMLHVFNEFLGICIREI